MLQLANVSKWCVWISGFPFSALVYLATDSQIPATSAAKISVHILEILQPARSKHTSYVSSWTLSNIQNNLPYGFHQFGWCIIFPTILDFWFFPVSPPPPPGSSNTTGEINLSNIRNISKITADFGNSSFKASQNGHMFRFLGFLSFKYRMKTSQVFKFLFKNSFLMLLALVLALYNGKLSFACYVVTLLKLCLVFAQSLQSQVLTVKDTALLLFINSTFVYKRLNIVF